MTRTGPNLSEDKRCLILADYLDGTLIMAEIAEKYSVSISYAATIARRSGFPLRRKSRFLRDWLFCASRRFRERR